MSYRDRDDYDRRVVGRSKRERFPINHSRVSEIAAAFQTGGDYQPQKLSRCELRAVALAAEGLTVNEAAALLHYSPETIKEQRKWAMAKLEARTISHAVALALRQQLIK